MNAALQSGGAQLVSEASVPSSPVRPEPFRTGVLSVFLGAFFGAGVAFLIEYLDDSIKTKEELERTVPLSVGDLDDPAVPNWKVREEPRIVPITEPTSPAAEAYRTLRTAIQFMGVTAPYDGSRSPARALRKGRRPPWSTWESPWLGPALVSSSSAATSSAARP